MSAGLFQLTFSLLNDHPSACVHWVNERTLQRLQVTGNMLHAATSVEWRQSFTGKARRGARTSAESRTGYTTFYCLFSRRLQSCFEKEHQRLVKELVLIAERLKGLNRTRFERVLERNRRARVENSIRLMYQLFQQLSVGVNLSTRFK